MTYAQLFKKAFHPSDPPYGMQFYDFGCLTSSQIKALNEMKLIIMKENEVYIKAHPEIKNLISILLKYILHKKPYIEIPEVIGTFFNRPRREIITDLLNYEAAIEAEEQSKLFKDYFRRDISDIEIKMHKYEPVLEIDPTKCICKCECGRDPRVDDAKCTD